MLNNKLNKVNLEKKYCKFYNLFGRCCRGDACIYVHDPSRIAICQRCEILFNLEKKFCFFYLNFGEKNGIDLDF